MQNTQTSNTPYIPAKGEKLALGLDFYPDGIVIPVNKPYGWTSADVIRKIKYAAIRHFGKKNLKIGHAGTLDPLATGILLICIGKATKLAERLQSHDKEYLANVTFGATTPSYDLEKEIDRFFPFEHINEEAARAVLPRFLGEQDQMAPLFSAKSVDGVRAYEIARKLFMQRKAESLVGDAVCGVTAQIIRTARIRINEIELVSFTPAAADAAQRIAAGGAGDAAGAGRIAVAETGEAAERIAATKARPNGRAGPGSRINITDNSALGLPEAVIRVSCSKGTYIRALARDLGEALSSGAHLSGLIRSRSGDFTLSQALSLDDTLGLFQ